MQKLTDGALICPGIVDFIIANCLRTIHSLVEHVQLHVLLVHQFLLVTRINTIAVLALRVIVLARDAELCIL